MLLFMSLGFVLFSIFQESELYSTDAPCKDLTGTWENELKSNFTIEKIIGTNFIGSYYTAVESNQGAFRNVSKVSGKIKSIGIGSLIGFNVIFSNGGSPTTWVGQCIVCRGQEIIFTSWIIRNNKQPSEEWLSTTINENTFYRRKDGSKNVNEVNISSTVQDFPNDPGLKGDWNSSTKDSFTIRRIQQNGLFDGTNRAAGEKAYPSFGRFDGNETHIALCFISATPNKIVGLVGHIRHPNASRKRVGASWLEHTYNPSCTDPRKYVNFYMANYTKI